MTIQGQNSERQTETIRFELRRSPKDFINDKRAYYAYVLSKGECIGSAKMSREMVIPVQIDSRTAKEKANFKIIMEAIEEDLKSMAVLLDESEEDKGEFEQDIENLWVIKKRGRPSSGEIDLIRTTILISEEDRKKLKILGGSSWIREQIRKAQLPDNDS